MPRPLYDSEHIFGLHDPGGEHLMLEAGRSGWVLFSEAIGHDPDNYDGKDFSAISNQEIGVLCRLNNGYYPEGTIPRSNRYEDFARRCANFVASSRGCKTWIIGNEMNYSMERPRTTGWPAPPHPNEMSHAASSDVTGLANRPDPEDPTLHGFPERFNALHSIRSLDRPDEDESEAITPQLYARCYRLCRHAIHQIPGHANDQVLMGAVAPWNNQTAYPGNPDGDWVQYFRDVLELLGPDECDGITLHTYTQGSDPDLIYDERLLTGHPDRHQGFLAYRDFMRAIPPNMRHLPVYITETDQIQPWTDDNSGWVQNAYGDINWWNNQPGNQQIRALILYRWTPDDRWAIESKGGVIEDFRRALQMDYRWKRMPGVHSDTRPLYRAEWIKGPVPAPLVAGTVVTFPITVKNAGNFTWTQGEINSVQLGYRYYQNREPVPVRPEQNIRTPLPQDVAPGETVTFDARIALPNRPGNYTLKIDLIREGVTWFEDQYSDVLTRWIKVSAVGSPPEQPAESQSDDSLGESGSPVPQQSDFSHGNQGEGTHVRQYSDISSDSPAVPSPNRPADVAGLPSRTAGVAGLPSRTAYKEPAQPRIADIVNEMPHGDEPYQQRDLRQIRYLVINHTGAPPIVPVDVIAQAHIQRGYPGIAYHFMVASDGGVFKVADLEEVVQLDQDWSGAGINLCLEGNFNQEPPPPAQLEATIQICTWLAYHFNLTADAIVGVCELMDAQSPGDTFLDGPAWKNELVQSVARLLEASRPQMDAQTEAATPNVQQVSQSKPPQTQQGTPESARTGATSGKSPVSPAEGSIDTPGTAQKPAPPATGEAERPPIRDITNHLPRDPEGFHRRRPEDVQFLVINHTAAAPRVAIQVIAEVYRETLPGILYHYFVDADGVIFQTQPLMEAVDSEQPHIANAVNIAFAGDFSQEIPTPAQITSGARLIAWLLGQFPQLNLDHVRGVSEFMPHSSPGEQWLKGKRWKEALLSAVRKANLGHDDPISNAASSELTRQVDALRNQLREQQEQIRRGQQENDRLRRQFKERQDREGDGRPVPKPPIRNIAHWLPQHPTLRYERRSLEQITHIAVHHTANPAHIGPQRLAELHVTEDQERGKEPWPGIGYHFFVHADGTLEQTNDLETVCYHVFRHNHQSVGIAFAGSFMNGNIPTTVQLKAGAHLIAWLAQRLKVPSDNILGHRDFPQNTTVCPGNEWNEDRCWRNTLLQQIQRALSGQYSKRLYHYMFFWQRPHPGPIARQDVLNAMPYVERFRPALGFSIEDAMQAEFVTIVGGESGVSSADEARIRQSGSQVERLAGKTESETVRILQDLVKQDRRFRDFDES